MYNELTNATMTMELMESYSEEYEEYLHDLDELTDEDIEANHKWYVANYGKDF